GGWRPAAQALGFSVPAGGWPVADLISRWRAFKDGRDLVEHEDYVALALRNRLPPPAPVLLVDEFQDVSRAQGELIRQWIGSGEVDRVYVAGDPDQSIYSFRGCDPSVFTSLPAVDEGASADRARPVSFRCPESVMAAAEEVLGYPARVDPCGRSGMVRHVAPATPGMLAAQVEAAVRYAREVAPGRQPVFVLTRFRRNVRSLAGDLGREGIPCTGIRRGRVNRWTSVRVGRSGAGLEPVAVSPWALVQALVRYVGGSDIDPDPLPKEAARALVVAVLSGEDRSRALAEVTGMARVTVGALYHWTGGNLGEGIYARLNLRPWVVASIRAAIDRQSRRGYAIGPEDVRVDTVHASKGLEAAVVLLHTGYLRGRLAGFPDAAAVAEERRIFYVGATRASHALVVLDYGPGPTTPILSGVGM
ncbi:MAG: UvrD-helicase domain-containing protein, partial [Methanomicrobiales archaeon]